MFALGDFLGTVWKYSFMTRKQPSYFLLNDSSKNSFVFSNTPPRWFLISCCSPAGWRGRGAVRSVGLGWGAAASVREPVSRGTEQAQADRRPLSNNICLSALKPHSQARTGAPRAQVGAYGGGWGGAWSWSKLDKIKGRTHTPDSCPVPG